MASLSRGSSRPLCRSPASTRRDGAWRRAWHELELVHAAQQAGSAGRGLAGRAGLGQRAASASSRGVARTGGLVRSLEHRAQVLAQEVLALEPEGGLLVGTLERALF